MELNKPREPVEYRVKEKSLIGNEMFEAGAIAKYDGLPAENLEPLCDVGRARYQEYLDSNKSRIANMIAGHSESAVGDPNLFMKEWAAAQQKAAAEQAEQIASAVSAGIASGLAQMAEMMKTAMASPAAPTEQAEQIASAAGTGNATSIENAAAGQEGGEAPAKRTRA